MKMMIFIRPDKFKGSKFNESACRQCGGKTGWNTGLYMRWWNGLKVPLIQRNSWQHYVKTDYESSCRHCGSAQPIQDLVPYFVPRKSFNYIPVVENQRLIGMIRSLPI